jgi:hypothetical protein
MEFQGSNINGHQATHHPLLHGTLIAGQAMIMQKAGRDQGHFSLMARRMS